MVAKNPGIVCDTRAYLFQVFVEFVRSNIKSAHLCELLYAAGRAVVCHDIVDAVAVRCEVFKAFAHLLVVWHFPGPPAFAEHAIEDVQFVQGALLLREQDIFRIQ